MKDQLYSIRMHASCQGRHVSGAERIVRPDTLDAAIRELTARATARIPLPDQITITAENLKGRTLQRIKALNMTALDVSSVPAGRSAAVRALLHAGASLHSIEQAINHLSKGASTSGHAMRGAIIMDARTGERLEPDQERGVRASRFDWDEQTLVLTRKRFAALGLTHFRTFEALALATKVAHAPGAVAELCWSDDPDYTAGYVASLHIGYLRIPELKISGDPHGGRVFFVDGDHFDLGAFVRYLQLEPVLITSAGECRAASTLENYLQITKQSHPAFQ
ncbi:MAG TPA: 6-carboxyhexanoate--CoA ligase [Nitrospirota bacterium]|nr:6-carboxyhexanoate--CoA ligase [Nitrospirota bacterium]